jgi:hypothetical protein
VCTRSKPSILRFPIQDASTLTEIILRYRLRDQNKIQNILNIKLNTDLLELYGFDNTGKEDDERQKDEVILIIVYCALIIHLTFTLYINGTIHACL